MHQLVASRQLQDLLSNEIHDHLLLTIVSESVRTPHVGTKLLTLLTGAILGTKHSRMYLST